MRSDFETRFAPYNQVEQTLLDASGEFAANTHGVNVVAIRLEDLGGFDLARVRSNTRHLLEVLRSAHLRAPTILCLCPESGAFLAGPERARAADDIADDMAKDCEIPGIHFLDRRQVDALYPEPDYEAPETGRLGHIPYTESYFAALGTALVRRAHSIERPPYKVIALDCDDTLWKGLCGEDGPAGIALDPPRRALQQFMLAQRQAGMLLAIASKNNDADVVEAFERNPGMPLRLSDFAAHRVNWESKADNLAALAAELDLGLDSFIFVDDNPKECAEVETGVPEVLSVPLPADPQQIPDFLRHVWAFDHAAVTDADRERASSYTRAQGFSAGLRSTSNLRQFMAGLDLNVRIAPLTAADLPRAAQLTQRTNQFNFTTSRRSESELEHLLRDPAHRCFTVGVSDRFGDYGLTGFILGSTSGAEFVIDTFLLSCRVLGRGVEHRVMAFLANLGFDTIVATLVPTTRNAPARHFLDSLGAPDKSLTYRFPAAALRGLEWKPVEATAPAPVQTARAAIERSTPEYVRIARTLATPAQIVAEMRRESRGAMTAPASNPPSTETEIRLAEIWADLLHAPSIAASDNFFDLGGHSLLAVLLLVRIQETFGVELSIDDVYSGALTLAELAERIDMSSPEYVQLLQEIEALSDEEARRMLAEGEP